MNLNVLMKYVIWIVFFGIVLAAIYFMFKKLGMI